MKCSHIQYFCQSRNRTFCEDEDVLQLTLSGTVTTASHVYYQALIYNVASTRLDSAVKRHSYKFLAAYSAMIHKTKFFVCLTIFMQVDILQQLSLFISFCTTLNIRIIDSLNSHLCLITPLQELSKSAELLIPDQNTCGITF